MLVLCNRVDIMLVPCWYIQYIQFSQLLLADHSHYKLCEVGVEATAYNVIIFRLVVVTVLDAGQRESRLMHSMH